ncbi:hypothetical protein APR12_004376 [Nocardia amikacinitolerans]|uniref:hypothetical protein n=2 Tax=Nocardia amikacinitolerans TaxID=756689 RepID=UPI000834CAAB|nr:hypothetical protein [Nocardia amikacinitolerans]MCP2277241.1 hypothetical protein [Nocardia amikacinitolerans]MCP2319013.1 hypothetical protein [Nocardia amikacinitolerans]
MLSLMDRVQQWEIEHRDCASPPIVMDRERAALVLSWHAEHGPHCRQYLAALACVSTVLD